MWKVGNTEMESVNKYKYLGKVLTTNGKLEEHIKSKESKINGLINQIIDWSHCPNVGQASTNRDLRLYPEVCFSCIVANLHLSVI